MSNRLSEILTDLGVKMVVIIENDFMPISDSEEIVSGMLQLNEIDQELLLNELIQFDDIKTTFFTFKTQFTGLSNDHQKQTALSTRKVIKMYLEKRKDEAEYNDALILGNQLAEMVEKLISDTPEINKVFLRYGIERRLPNYDDLFKNLTTGDTVPSKRIYNEINDDLWDTIINDISSRNVQNDDFILFIVDKSFEESNDAGVSFINDYVLKANRNFISVVYTSQQRELEIRKLEDHYLVQVSKSDIHKLQKLEKGIIECAYVHLFKRLKQIQIDSVTEAIEFAFKRKENMIYLSRMANLEGVTAFEIITKWIEHMKNETIQQKLFNEGLNYSEYAFIVGLTKFINDKYIDTENPAPINIEFEDKVSQLNTFELFDYSVNKKHLPPAPGDIFCTDDEEYFILVGQDCDTIVRRREEISRKAVNADLLRCNFSTAINEEKMKIEKKEIIYSYFKDINNNVGTLGISFDDMTFGDFNIFDLCVFNYDGSCKISLQQSLDVKVERVVPETWKNYYTKLQERLMNINQINMLLSSNGRNLTSLSANEFNIYDFSFDDETVTYPLKRICRLAGDFREHLLKAYWEYRGRIGVNTIHLSDRKKIELTRIEYGLVGKELIPVNQAFEAYLEMDRDKLDIDKKLIINCQEIKEVLPGIDLERPTISLRDKLFDNLSKISYEKLTDGNDLLGLRIIMPYVISSSNKRISKENITIFDLIDEAQRNLLLSESKSSIVWAFIGDDQLKLMLCQNGKPKSFSLAILEGGIQVPSLSVKIIIKDNSIEITEDVFDKVVS